MNSCVSLRERLTRLALDLSVPVREATSELWNHLNPELWQRTRNAWAVLQTASQTQLEACSNDLSFLAHLERTTCEAPLKEEPNWFAHRSPTSAVTSVAYFSMEFMLSEALPIYSGGLGNVAGDQLKAANDLGVPVTEVGLLYSQGYFRQELSRGGSQIAMYPFNDPGQLPIKPVRSTNGEWLRFTIPFPGCDLWIRAWKAKVGQLRLLLLDTNDPGEFSRVSLHHH